MLPDSSILLSQSEEPDPGIFFSSPTGTSMRWHFSEVFLNNFTSLSTNKKSFKQIFWTMKTFCNLYTLPSPWKPLLSQPGLWMEAAIPFCSTNVCIIVRKETTRLAYLNKWMRLSTECHTVFFSNYISIPISLCYLRLLWGFLTHLNRSCL